MSFDYAFIGMGCANSLILMELHSRDMLTNKRIVIYEPAQKVANDRTFCFWLEPDKLKALALDQLVTHSWSSVKVNALEAQSLAGKNSGKDECKPLTMSHFITSQLVSALEHICSKAEITLFSS